MIHNFEKFNKLNEASRSKIEKVQGMFEDMVEEDFVKKYHGDKTKFYDDDYELDSDTERSSTGMDTIVWIEIKNATSEALALLDKDYKAFAAPFEAWCQKHKLYNPEVTTPDPNEENSIIYKVTL